MYNFLTPYAIDVFEPIAKWLAIGVVCALVIAGILLFFINREIFNKLFKPAFFCLLIFLLAIGIAGLSMEIAKSFNPNYISENGMDRQAVSKYVFIPTTCLLALILISAIVIAVISKKASPETVERKRKIAFITCGIVCLCALIATGILLAVYFEQIKGWYKTLNQTALYISASLLVITVLALAFILNDNKKPIDTKCISMAGVCIAMSFGLSYIKLFPMPQGGSVTLFSLLPIMVFSYVYGTKKGVFACFIYGILQAIQDPWIIHPAQFLLDYPIAFAGIGLSGALKNVKLFAKTPQLSFVLGGIIASAFRFLSHVFSGVFAFATYGKGIDPWVYSLTYNSFVFVDIAITLVVGFIVFSSKAFVKEMKKIQNV